MSMMDIGFVFTGEIEVTKGPGTVSEPAEKKEQE